MFIERCLVAPTREELKQATRERVVEAAGRLFRERGFTATTVRDIALAAQVSTGTVMTVGDKNTLLVRVFDTMVAAEHARGGGLEPTGGTCVDRLSRLVQPYLALFLHDLDLARTYASVIVSGTHTSALFTDLATQLVEEFAAAITLRGCTAASDAPARAQALYLAYLGALFAGSARSPVDPSGVVDDLRATFAAICTCKE